ncbi:MAG TPA: putative O-glycosylation ligase, exosortase A system-associated, partial [Planctomycetota bacterium]|nr:putative O-glycosylation ligase, exosortase A system-associated [Planctomycetota bacterium]
MLSAFVIYLLLAGAMVATFVEPFVGLVTWYVLSFLRPQDIYWYAFRDDRLSLYCAIAVLLALVPGRVLRGERPVVFTATTGAIAGLWAWAIVSSLVSDYPQPSLVTLQALSKVLLFCILAAGLASTEARLRVTIWTIVLSLGILAIRGNLEYFLDGKPRIEGPGAAAGIAAALTDRNLFAMHLVMAVPLAAFLLLSERKPLVRAGLIGLIAFLVHAVLLTFSRGGLIGLAVVAGYVVWRVRSPRLRLAALVACLVLVALFAGPPVRATLDSIVNYDRDASAQSRFGSWQAGLSLMWSYPVFGVGLSNFERYSARFDPTGGGPLGGHAAHNAFLQIGGDLGLPGLAFYVAVLACAFANLRRARRLLRGVDAPFARRCGAMASGLEGALAGFVVCGMFLSLELLE